MTTDEFRAWLEANFPDHARRGRPKHGEPSDAERAADLLGISVQSLFRKRDGKQPITPRDEAILRNAALRT